MAGFESGYKAGSASTPKTSLGLEFASVGANYQKIKAQKDEFKSKFNNSQEKHRNDFRETTGEEVNEIEFSYTGLKDVDATISALQKKSEEVLNAAVWGHKKNLFPNSELTKVGSLVTQGMNQYSQWISSVKDVADTAASLDEKNTASPVNEFVINSLNSAVKGIGFSFDANGFIAHLENGSSIYGSNLLENFQARERVDLIEAAKDIVGTPGGQELKEGESIATYYDQGKDYSKSIDLFVNGLDPRSKIDVAVQLNLLDIKPTAIEGDGFSFSINDLSDEEKTSKLNEKISSELNSYLFETLGNRKVVKLDSGKEEEEVLTLPPTRMYDTNVYPGATGEAMPYGEAALVVDILRPIGLMDDKLANEIKVGSGGSIVADMQRITDNLRASGEDNEKHQSNIDLANENPDLFRLEVTRDSKNRIISSQAVYKDNLDIKAYTLSFDGIKPDEIGISASSNNKLASLNGVVIVTDYPTTTVYDIDEEGNEVERQEYDTSKGKEINIRFTGSSIKKESISSYTIQAGKSDQNKLKTVEAKKDLVPDVTNPNNDAQFMTALPLIREKNPEFNAVFNKYLEIEKQNKKSLTAKDYKVIFANALSQFN